MAYIVSTTQTATANAATYTVTLGAHVSGDLLLVKVSQDGGGTTIAPDATSTTAGWAMIGTQAASGASRSAWAWLIADSSSEVNPVFTGATDDWIGTCLVIRDAHATEPFGASPTSAVNFIRTDWNNVSSSACGTLTPPEDECLLIYSWNADGSNQYMRCKLNEVTAADKYATGSISHIVGYRQQQTAASTAGSATMYNINATEGGNGWVLAVRNKSGGILQPDVRPDITELKWHGSWEATHDSITWGAPSAFAASINSITCSATVPTVVFTGASATTTWGTLTNIQNSDNTAGAWVGGTFSLAAPVDMTGKVFGFQFSRAQFSGSTLQGADGVLVGFSDGTNWVTYQVIVPAKVYAAGEDISAFVALGNATVYASNGSVASAISGCNRIGYFWHRIGSSATAANLYVKNATLFGVTALTGGGISRPVTFQDYQSAMNSWGVWQWAELNASAQVKAKSSLQIGDGTNATYFDGAAQSFEYPQTWSATSVANWQMGWNAASNSVGLSVKAKSGDTINLASGVAATDTAQNLSINASSSASATYSFAQSFVGWRDPIDNVGLGWNGATFKECGTVTIAGGGDLTNCTIANTTSTNAPLAITANGTVLDSCTTSVDPYLGATKPTYHIELGTAVTAVTLTDHTFTGSALTDKVHVLRTTDTVTITISGTTSLVAGDVTSAGATVVIAAPQPTLDATVLSGSRVVLYNNTTSAELDNTAPAGTSWSKTITSGASANDSLTLFAFKEGYQEFSTTFLYTGDDATILVTQATDPNLTSLRTELGITDYTTITEFALDVTGTVEIDADDADGSTLKARLAIWYNGVLTTEDGARYLRGAITILSTAAFRINVDVLDLQVTNISATYGLQFTDTERRLYRSDGTPVYSSTSAAGSIQNDYSGVPDTVETGVSGLTGSESAQLMGLPSATTTATAVLSAAQTTPIHSDVRKVNSYTVDGTGTDGDPWGPA